MPLAIVGVVLGAVGVVSAAFIFIFSGINHEAFQREYPQIEDFFTVEEKRAFDKKFALSMALILSGIGLLIAAFVLSFVLTENLRRNGGEFTDDFISMTIVGAFLFALSFLCGGLCYMGVQHSKYDVKEYNREIAVKNKHIKFNKIFDAFCGAVMLTATGIYLLLGFVWNLWHPGWVVFPIGGIICAIITTFQKCFERDKDNHEEE